MATQRSRSLLISSLGALALLVTGCAANKPYRTNDLSGDLASFQTCNVEKRDVIAACDESYYSTYRYDDNGDSYDFDLAFVEFTERGAVFNQTHMDSVVERIGKKAKSDSGVTAVVYVHGWKNNATAANGNVRKFRELLAKTAKLQSRLAVDTGVGARKLVGIYVGWRGASLEVEPFNQLSYWDRKAVAEEVGKGGVTELLLRLERTLRNEESNPNKNLYLVTGHSLGAAVVLTGLNEIFIERIIDKTQDEGCVAPTDPFGHGVALLNPAIETSEILELKQLAAQNCFRKHQERLMHVISSDADAATTGIFEAAQWLGLVIGWSQARFDRKFDLADEPITFDEAEMDTTTIGNYEPFLTGYLFSEGSETAAEYGLDQNCIIRSRSETWRYVPFKGEKGEDCFKKIFSDKVHVPVRDHEPLAFIKTDEGFIGDHNDVFNENVAAYLAAIVAENRFIRARKRRSDTVIWRTAFEGPPECHPTKTRSEGHDEGFRFDFGRCFDAYHEAFCELGEGESDLGRHETCNKIRETS